VLIQARAKAVDASAELEVELFSIKWDYSEKADAKSIWCQ
jgi:hypothetical protein